MFTRLQAHRAVLAVVVSIAAAPTAHAGDQFPRPGSFAAIESVKDPAHYGAHLPAADLPAPCSSPKVTAIQALLAIKAPSHHGPHLAAADQPSHYLAPLPGSPQALLAAKNPARFGPHPTPAEEPTDYAEASMPSVAAGSSCQAPATPAG